jgi:ATP-dependent helicase Lhr and Lhr-like helicase
MPAMDPLAAFSPPTRAWFAAAFPEPTAVQAAAWPRIRAGRSVLAVAPTGSGKTLAAFLWAIDRCLAPRPERGVRVLYVSPLKALAVDVERNLRAPLAGITAQSVRMGRPEPRVSVGLRTGDTPAAERAAMLRRPPDVLITTPESLFLLLTSRGREILADVETVIVDEVHAIAGSKRGAHLAVTLARLDHLAGRAIPRVGLSATVRPMAEAARFLGGDVPVEVVHAGTPKEWELRIEVPVEDMADLATDLGPDATPSASIWPHVEARIVELVEQHRSTIVFANSRRLAERLTARLNELHAERLGQAPPAPISSGPPAQVMAQAGATAGAPPLLARAHHGSVSKEQRAQIEDDLKTGRLRAVVATSSLELGIDMGAVDLVVQVEAPPSVASGLQRVGRAGHQVGAVSEGVVLPKYRGDLLASAVVVARMRAGELESLRVPANPLDVAAQQVVAAVAMEDWAVDDLLALLRRTAPFRDLTPAVFASVLDMLAGRYPSDAFAELRPRLVWDRREDVLRARPGAQRLAVTSGGTIPDRGLFPVHLEGGGRVGELDEEMVHESRVGDTIALGASSWQVTTITHDRVHVVPAPGAPGRLPFWRGDALGRPAELGRAIGAFTRELAARPEAEAVAWLADQGLDAWAARNLVGYVAEQAASGSHVPSDRTIVVERTRDELGDWRLAVLSPFGARVHAPWALVARERLTDRFGVDAAVLHGDDGIVARLPDVAGDDWLAEAVACLFPPADEVEAAVTRLVGSSALFAARFRECASRALLLPRPQPGRRTPLWQQRQRAAQLLQVAAEHPTFPIVLETVRECLQDAFDLPALAAVLEQVEHRRIRVVEASPHVASPFARSLLFGYVAEYLYEGDSPLAERRAAALTLDLTLLGELLGQADLRELLDPEAIEQVVARLQHLDPERHARHQEDAADLLRVLGPLSTQAAAARGVDADWLTDLETQRRAFRTRMGGTEVWAAAEDAPRLRDGIGAPLPPGLPAAHLEAVADPVGDLVARYARTHGPFTTQELATGLDLPVAVAADRLADAQAAGRLLEGRFLAGAVGNQWCHPEVLRWIKRRSIALLRQQIEPVSQAALAAFLPRWQHVGPQAVSSLRGVEGVLEVVRELAGVPVPASALETSILPARIPGYEPGMLDELTGAGEVLWTGASALPGGDAWIALAPAELAMLLPRSAELPTTPLTEDVLALLERGGGWFLADVARQLAGAGVDAGAVADAVRALLWAGRIGNDTIEPFRAARDRARPARGRPAPRRRLARPPRGRYADLRRGPGGDRGGGDLGSGTPARALVPTPGTRAWDLDLPGRWFALGDPTAASPPEVRAVAAAEAHLDRLGLVTRGAVVAAGDPGGFAAAYRTLGALEERGRVQRVYAVDGLGAAQFALPGVVDQLRDVERELADGGREVLVLAASDPANAYGAALEWPASDWSGPGGNPHRPGRGTGSTVVLHGGEPVLYVERGGHSLLSFPPGPGRGEDDPAQRMAAAAAALHASVQRGRTAPLLVTRINGVPALDVDAAIAPVAAALVGAGFVQTPRGYRARP